MISDPSAADDVWKQCGKVWNCSKWRYISSYISLLTKTPVILRTYTCSSKSRYHADYAIRPQFVSAARHSVLTLSSNNLKIAFIPLPHASNWTLKASIHSHERALWINMYPRKHCGKGEIVHYEQFRLFTQCFQKPYSVNASPSGKRFKRKSKVFLSI